MCFLPTRKMIQEIQSKVHFDGFNLQGNQNHEPFIFNINIVKLLDKFPKLMESSLTLDFLKNYFKDIKDRCNKR